MFTEEEIKTLKSIVSNYRDKTNFFVKGGMNDVAYKVCKKHGLTLENLQSKERTRDHVIARVEFTKRCLEELGKSVNAVGKFLNKDHTTITYYKNCNYWKSK